MRCPITAQLVGDQLPGWSFLILQHLTKEARSGSTISTFGNQNIDYVSILIDSSPQIEVLTSDFDEVRWPRKIGQTFKVYSTN